MALNGVMLSPFFFLLGRQLFHRLKILNNYWMRLFLISLIIKVKASVISTSWKTEADNPNQDLDYSGYHKNQI